MVYPYRRYVELGFPDVASLLDYPVALSNWDNTPRSGPRGLVLEGGTPELFRRHLREALVRVEERAPDHQIIFLKSWNEWAEGNYVEPDRRFGFRYLEVIREELEHARSRQERAAVLSRTRVKEISRASGEAADRCGEVN